MQQRQQQAPMQQRQQQAPMQQGLDLKRAQVGNKREYEIYSRNFEKGENERDEQNHIHRRRHFGTAPLHKPNPFPVVRAPSAFSQLLQRKTETHPPIFQPEAVRVAETWSKRKHDPPGPRMQNFTDKRRARPMPSDVPTPAAPTGNVPTGNITQSAEEAARAQQGLPQRQGLDLKRAQVGDKREYEIYSRNFEKGENERDEQNHIHRRRHFGTAPLHKPNPFPVVRAPSAFSQLLQNKTQTHPPMFQPEAVRVAETRAQEHRRQEINPSKRKHDPAGPEDAKLHTRKRP